MPQTEVRYLIGPELLFGICTKDDAALAWADPVPPQNCFISSLTISILRSVIDRDGQDAAERDSWHRVLDSVKGNYVIKGGAIVEVTAEIVEKWRYWRDREPLEFECDSEREEVDQDVRLLLATADVLGLTFVEYDSLYLHQAAERGLRVQAIPRAN
jgi:hypothetical protein